MIDDGDAVRGDGTNDRDGASDALIAAIGKASEALEYVERARGALYEFHQLIGHADLTFGEAATMLANAGASRDAASIEREIVGRNVIDGRWTFQVVEEFDDLYYGPASRAVTDLERTHLGGRRHVFEARLKADRHTAGDPAHALRPPAAHMPEVDLDPHR